MTHSEMTIGMEWKIMEESASDQTIIACTINIDCEPSVMP
jgi:hypothetical protein